MTKLFKRAAVFTDIHWGLKNNSVIHNNDCMDFIDWFIKTAKARNCETCFFLGDWHHNRSSLSIHTLHYSIRALEKLNEAFDQVIFIVGNHDLYYRDRRDVQSVEWAKHLDRVRICNDWIEFGDVVIAPWLVGDDYKRLQRLSGKYLFGHFELPSFRMNANIEMPDHGEVNSEHLVGFERVFSGHFHFRQHKKNVTYIGNAFPHNYGDAGDDARGMMVLEWDEDPEYITWEEQPRYRVFTLSQILDQPERLLRSKLHCRVNLDIDISFEESVFIKEKLMPEYSVREMQLIPVKQNIESIESELGDLTFESVDSIVQSQIESLQEGNFDKRLLLEIYKNL